MTEYLKCAVVVQIQCTLLSFQEALELQIDESSVGFLFIQLGF